MGCDIETLSPTQTQTKQTMEEENENKPDLHAKDTLWDVRIAEMHLKGDTLASAFLPVLISMCEHIGQNATLTARSAYIADEHRTAKENLSFARIMSAFATTLRIIREHGFDKAGNVLNKITNGDKDDPAEDMLKAWSRAIGKIPEKHLALMDKRVICAFRMSLMDGGTSVGYAWDETICGKNVNDHPDVDREIIKCEKAMGINRTCPPLKRRDIEDIDDIDEDGVKTTINEIDGSGFSQVVKTADDADKPAKKKRSEKDIINDMLDDMLRKMEEKRKAKQDKDKQDKPDSDEPTPPSRFN